MYKVAVLMSVYSPNMIFLKEQVKSIVNQKYRTDLVIRIDGIFNSELKVYLSSLTMQYKNVKVVFGDNLGAQGSFLELLKITQGSYDLYAFADQDDVFTSDKISRAVEMIEDNNVPQLYCSRLFYINKNNVKLGKSKDLNNIGFGFKNILAENHIGGNCMVFNNSLCDLVLYSYGVKPIMHDWWVLLLASAFGKVVYDRKPCVLYRQHEMNLIGGTSSVFEHYINKIKNFSFDQSRNSIYAQSKLFSDYYMSNLDVDKQAVLKSFLDSKLSLNNRLKYLFSKDKVKRLSTLDNFILNILIIINKY